MGTSVDRELTPEEVSRLPAAKEAMMATRSQGRATRFTFLAEFDGTNNHKDRLALSADHYQTNIGNLHDQALASKSPGLVPSYYPGVGTGGDQGGLANAAFLPSSAVNAAAEKAYMEFSDAAIS